MIPSALWYHRTFLYKKNEVGFKCQRSLLQVPMKLASLGIEAGFIFLMVLCKNQQWLYKHYIIVL